MENSFGAEFQMHLQSLNYAKHVCSVVFYYYQLIFFFFLRPFKNEQSET